MLTPLTEAIVIDALLKKLMGERFAHDESAMDASAQMRDQAVALHTDELLDQIAALARVPRSAPQHPIALHLGRVGVREMHQRESELAATWAVYRNWLGAELRAPGGQVYGQSNAPHGDNGVFPVNYLPRWLELWSALYTDEPIRSFYCRSNPRGAAKAIAPDDGDMWRVVECLQRRYRQARIDSVLRRVDILLRLLGNVVVVPHYDADHDELVIHQYKSHRVRVIENHDNPARPLATALVGRVRRQLADGSTDFMDVAQVWTDRHMARVAGDTIAAIFALPGRPPLVHCFDTPPDNESGYFVDCPGPALADLAIRLINDGYSDINYTSLMQGFGVMQIFGAGPNQDLVIGPGRVIQFSGDTNRREGIEFASPNAPLSERLNVLQTFVEHIRQAYGIPASMLEVDGDASGAAIVQANGPLAEIRRERAKVFRSIETDLVRATLGVLAGHDPELTGIAVCPEDWDVCVNYTRPQASHSPRDRIDLERHDLEHGIRDRADILLERYPDRYDSVDEARAELRQQHD